MKNYDIDTILKKLHYIKESLAIFLENERLSTSLVRENEENLAGLLLEKLNKLRKKMTRTKRKRKNFDETALTPKE